LGHVLDLDTNSFVADAKVTVNKQPAVRTDSTGSFPIPVISLLSPQSNEVEVTVEKDGYETTTQKLSRDGLLVVGIRRKK
jgi:hypothetical protein